MIDTESSNKKLDTTYKNIFDKKFLKFDCGIENDDLRNISFMSFFYSLAGFNSIDVSFNIEAVESVNKSLKKAYEKAKELEINLISNTFITVSLRDISFSQPSFEYNFTQILNYKVKIIELHIQEEDIEVNTKLIEWVSKIANNQLISLSLNRKNFSNASLIELIKIAKDILKSRLIIELHGTHFSGVKNLYNETLQAISTVDIINKQLKYQDIKFRKLPIIIAGGVNSFTRQLAEQCNVEFQGLCVAESEFDSFMYKNQNEIISNNNEIKKSVEFIKAKFLNF